MRISNKHNLPEPIVTAFGIDDYDRGTADHTATELIKPVRIRAFTHKFWEEMEEDVSDRVWRFFGSVKHLVLERIAKSNPQRYLVEQRFETAMPQTGKTVSGKIDLFDRDLEILYDYKESSVWKFMLGDTREWEEQANINCYILRQNNIYPKKLINITWLKDWKIREARLTRKKDYPQCAIHVVELPRWTIGQQQDYIQRRIEDWDRHHENPPFCSKEERWQRDASFALMKEGRKNAVKLFFNRDQAEAAKDWALNRGYPKGKYYVEERIAEPVRCLDHCPVRTFCDYGIEARKKWREHLNGDEE
jgi:hypothetical protein